MRIGLILLFAAVVLVFCDALPCADERTQIGQPCEHNIVKRSFTDFFKSKAKDAIAGLFTKAKSALKDVLKKAKDKVKEKVAQHFLKQL
uniref:Maxadilan related protein n=1 Tax=Nyssomyia intermedia TaxID=182990 RepID=J7HBR9_9DIPT